MAGMVLFLLNSNWGEHLMSKKGGLFSLICGEIDKF
ncbi:hypothetical protein SPLC1_S180060 [Arthrospira platensis C1]|nr:hypothetical protein SPLC1_S180060 [Arthrospira platensis C1]